MLTNVRVESGNFSYGILVYALYFAELGEIAWQNARRRAVVIRRAFIADRIYYERYKFESLERPARALIFPCTNLLYFMLNARFSDCSFVLRFGIGTRLSGGVYARQSKFK